MDSNAEAKLKDLLEFVEQNVGYVLSQCDGVASGKCYRTENDAVLAGRLLCH